jgi:ABC-type multidrug transport system fused ATPase/permease subunit
MPDKKVELARLIKKRIAHDKQWGAFNFGCAHIFAWVAVLSSFGSAIVAATGKVSPVLTAILASISGCVIVLARNLNFMSLSRWHHKLAAHLQAIERSMEFENKPPEQASAEFSKKMIEFENNSPVVNVGGLDGDNQPG